METVEKTLDVLEVFLKQEGETGIAEIAALSGVNISTAHRITADLVRRGYLRQRQKRGKYSIGIKLLEFSNSVQKALKVGDVAQPYLEKLSKECGEYCEIAILDKFAAVTVAQAEVDHNLRIKNIVGERLPLHSTSVGKLLLAFMSSAEREKLYHSELRAFTPKTLSERDSLEKEIARIRKQGYSVDDLEYDLGIWSVAAPILDFSESVIAGLAIAAPSYRTNPEKAAELTRLVRKVGREISLEMGFKEN